MNTATLTPNSIADLHERLGRSLDRCGMLGASQHHAHRDPRKEHLRDLAIESVVRPVSPPPRDVSHANVARINADWLETERLVEAARVEHGFCTPAFRKAYRQILTRPDVLADLQGRAG